MNKVVYLLHLLNHCFIYFSFLQDPEMGELLRNKEERI